MGKFTAYKIPLHSLPAGVHQFDFHLDKVFFDNMENTDIHGADLQVKLSVEVKPQVYVLDFHITGTLTLICDRCLDNLVVPVDVTYSLNVKYGDSFDDSVDDLLVIPAAETHLNVAYLIYDTVALAIPMRHVHPAGQCNRAMSALLHKHRAQTPADSDEASLEQQLIEEIDDTPADDASAIDPRWNGLAKLIDNSDQ